jgi:hypothetical protein
MMKAIMKKMETPKLEVVRNDTPPEEPKVHYEFSMDETGKIEYQLIKNS